MPCAAWTGGEQWLDRSKPPDIDDFTACSPKSAASSLQIGDPPAGAGR